MKDRDNAGYYRFLVRSARRNMVRTMYEEDAARRAELMQTARRQESLAELVKRLTLGVHSAAV